MKIKLSSDEALNLSKAIKGGVLDTDKVKCLKALVDGYNPPKRIEQSELDYYLQCLYDGWGLIPNELNGEMRAELLAEAGKEPQLSEYSIKRIKNGTLYKEMVKYIFYGMVSLKGLGCRYVDKEPDFEWMSEGIPEW